VCNLSWFYSNFWKQIEIKLLYKYAKPHLLFCSSWFLAGGISPHVNTKLQFIVRQDLELSIDGCESLITEGKSSNSSGIKCYVGVIYRHPSSNLKLFSLHSLIYFNLLQPLGWRCAECAVHHEPNVREEQHPYIYGANKQ